MKFTYIAKDQQGKEARGAVNAPSREVAIINLQGRGFFIISIEAQIKKAWYGEFLSFFSRVSKKDLVIFTRQLATLLDAQISLPESLKTLYRQTENLTLKDALFEIVSDIDAGIAFSQALDKFGNIFSEFFRNMVRSAEVSGRLEETFSYLADYIEKENNLNRKIRNALIYPIIITLLFAIIAIVLLIFILPQIKSLTQEMGKELPYITRVFMFFGNLLIDFGVFILMLIALAAAIIGRYLKTEEGKSVKDELLLKVPIFKNIFKKIYLVRFAESTSVLIKGGIPVPTAMEIAGRVTANYVYRNILFNVAEAVRRGEAISRILSSYPVEFPSLITKMAAIGEETGKLEELLSRAAKFYSDELEDDLSGLSELIQPILIVIIGAFVGLFVASILMPIYNLVKGV